MNSFFTYIVTGLLLAIGLLSLGNDFPYAPLYILFCSAGLALSFWQYKKKPIPYLRIIANLILLALTVKALFPFFTGKPKSDVFSVLIATWIYFLILSTFIIYTKRDYYVIQGLALGLIVYACFYATHNPLLLLGYTAAFLVVWIMALRNISLFPESKEEKTIVYTAGDIWREVKLAAILFFAVLIISLPFYFWLPRFNIPLLPMDQLLSQRYSAIYTDFPKRGLVMYLSINPKDKMTKEKESEGETPSPTQGETKEIQVEITPGVNKPVFWHSQEELENLQQKMKKTDQELKDLARQHELPDVEKNIQQQEDLLKEEEKISQEKEKLQNAIDKVTQEYLKMAKLQANPSPEVAGNPQALKELEDKMAGAENKIQGMVEERKAMDKKLDGISQAVAQIRSSVYRQASQTTQQIRILWDKKEEQELQLKKLKQPQPIPPQQNKPEEKESKSKKSETKKIARRITVLDFLLYSLIILTIIYILKSIVAFILPYARHKRRILRASRRGEYNLSISLIYNFLGRILYIFGYKYPVVMLPEEYLGEVNKKFAVVSGYTQELTRLFIEARYSTHQLRPQDQKQAFENYRNILQELKNSGSLWQRQVLKMGFLFEL